MFYVKKANFRSVKKPSLPYGIKLVIALSGKTKVCGKILCVSFYRELSKNLLTPLMKPNSRASESHDTNSMPSPFLSILRWVIVTSIKKINLAKGISSRSIKNTS
ncbi:Uncharacterised protein [Legionella hackeliae]|uniref:Uncharacterized protein n=1 Tax=Legionella hackeliae TaxID=449 RepID=A0A0A8UY19_LEGHA|nr:hypothetical protein Lhac_2446 [Legionella hackeliae]CEK11614.1 protein of unknown function [Legionella hackeliae]STX48386.1 Uncharacterised protein [Legionella hackeliae]